MHSSRLHLAVVWGWGWGESVVAISQHLVHSLTPLLAYKLANRSVFKPSVYRFFLSDIFSSPVIMKFKKQGSPARGSTGILNL